MKKKLMAIWIIATMLVNSIVNWVFVFVWWKYVQVDYEYLKAWK